MIVGLWKVEIREAKGKVESSFPGRYVRLGEVGRQPTGFTGFQPRDAD